MYVNSLISQGTVIPCISNIEITVVFRFRKLFSCFLIQKKKKTDAHTLLCIVIGMAISLQHNIVLYALKTSP